MKSRCGLLVLGLLLFALPERAWAEEPTVRVAILQGVDSIRLSVPGPCRLRDQRTGAVLGEWPELKWQEVRPANPGLSWGGKELNSEGVLLEMSPDTVFRVNAQPYRGSLIVQRTPEGRLQIINRLDLEDYLVGALSSEVNAGWPLEALKAHAVVSRTMAAHRVWIRRKEAFDMTADVSTHLYHGVAAEKPRARQAVEATRGQVLAYRGELFSATFHASCGGHTEDAAELWNVKGDRAPLRGVEDPYCRNLKHYRWRTTLVEEEFLRLLAAAPAQIGRLREVALTERNASGRARGMRIRGSRGTVTLTGRQLREHLGANRLRSLKFTVSLDSGRVVFDGLGWGHGVGLCQWGAFGMAARGKKAEEILSFYFPGAQRRALEGLPGFVSDNNI